MPGNGGQSFPEKILCIHVNQKSKNREPLATFRRQGSYGWERDGEFEGQASFVTELPQEVQERDRARLGACFVPFVLFVAEPFPLRSHTNSGRDSGALTIPFP